MDDWATVEQVAAHVGAATDSNMTDCTKAANAFGYRTRPDLRNAQSLAEPPESWTVPDDVAHAVVLYAAVLWRERTSPQGFATYTEFGADGSEPGDAMTNIYRLLGSRRPVAM